MEISDFIELKPNKFTYCGKIYHERRFISIGRKIFISCDDGFNYVMVYEATKDGKGKLLSQLYHENNHNSYPIYTIEEAIKRLNNSGLILNDYSFKIHKSHYK